MECGHLQFGIKTNSNYSFHEIGWGEATILCIQDKNLIFVEQKALLPFLLKVKLSDKFRKLTKNPISMREQMNAYLRASKGSQRQASHVLKTV